MSEKEKEVFNQEVSEEEMESVSGGKSLCSDVKYDKYGNCTKTLVYDPCKVELGLK